MKFLFILPIRFYRKYISPLKSSPSCRFYPTCSAYAIEAIEKRGVVVGTMLAIWRILRCNPFSKGGFDPVPEKGTFLRRKNKDGIDADKEEKGREN